MEFDNKKLCQLKVVSQTLFYETFLVSNGSHMFVQWPSRTKMFILTYSHGHNICAVQRIRGPFQSALSASLQDTAIGYCPLTRSGSFCPWTNVGGVNKTAEKLCVTEIDQFSSPAPKRRQLQHKLEFLKRTISILQSTNTTTKIGREQKGFGAEKQLASLLTRNGYISVCFVIICRLQ